MLANVCPICYRSAGAEIYFDERTVRNTAAYVDGSSESQHHRSQTTLFPIPIDINLFQLFDCIGSELQIVG